MLMLTVITLGLLLSIRGTQYSYKFIGCVAFRRSFVWVRCFLKDVLFFKRALQEKLYSQTIRNTKQPGSFESVTGDPVTIQGICYAYFLFEFTEANNNTVHLLYITI